MFNKLLEKLLDIKGVIIFTTIHLLVFVLLTLTVYVFELTDPVDQLNALLLIYPCVIVFCLWVIYMKGEVKEDEDSSGD